MPVFEPSIMQAFLYRGNVEGSQMPGLAHTPSGHTGMTGVVQGVMDILRCSTWWLKTQIHKISPEITRHVCNEPSLIGDRYRVDLSVPRSA
ncbi:MAG: hypothetical protein MK102_14220, partial [Fuerstiella sp.]|nr:hypothetical protein [Fuerstiella sp.]